LWCIDLCDNLQGSRDSQISPDTSAANAIASNQVSDIDDLKKRLARIKSSVKD